MQIHLSPSDVECLRQHESELGDALENATELTPAKGGGIRWTSDTNIFDWSEAVAINVLAVADSLSARTQLKKFNGI